MTPAQTRARLRAAAARRLAAHGLAGFERRQVAESAGSKFDHSKYYYPTNAQLLIDMVREHQLRVGENMADAVLASRRAGGRERLHTLALAYLEAVAGCEWLRATRAVTAALPEVAEAARPGQAWLIAELAEAAGEPLLGRSLLLVLEDWGARLGPADAKGRETCAAMLAAMGSAPL